MLISCGWFVECSLRGVRGEDSGMIIGGLRDYFPCVLLRLCPLIRRPMWVDRRPMPRAALGSTGLLLGVAELGWDHAGSGGALAVGVLAPCPPVPVGSLVSSQPWWGHIHAREPSVVGAGPAGGSRCFRAGRQSGATMRRCVFLVGPGQPFGCAAWTGQAASRGWGRGARSSRLRRGSAQTDFPTLLALELQSYLVPVETRTLWSSVSGMGPGEMVFVEGCLWEEARALALDPRYDQQDRFCPSLLHGAPRTWADGLCLCSLGANSVSPAPGLGSSHF